MLNELNRMVLSVFTRIQIKRDDGQALVEYTLILALVSIAAVAILGTVGGDIKEKLETVAAAI